MSPFKLWMTAIGLKLAVFVVLVYRQEQPPAVLMPSVEELQQAVFESIQYEDGFLFVRDTLLETLLVIPADAPWTIKCGFGISLTFTQGRDVSTEVQITSEIIPPDLCREIAPVVARAIATIGADEANVSHLRAVVKLGHPRAVLRPEFPSVR